MHESKIPNHCGVYIAGLGSESPPHLHGPESLEFVAEKFYDVNRPGLKKLLSINRTSGIQTRAFILDFSPSNAAENPILQPDAPSISQIDALYRTLGIQLAVRACEKALAASQIPAEDITHLLAVTCTTTCSPGIQYMVGERLGLAQDVQYLQLAGVGCAGGVALLRAATQAVMGERARGRKAKVLAVACEVSSTNVRCILERVEKVGEEDVDVSGVLFGDGAGAMVVCDGWEMEMSNGSGEEDTTVLDIGINGEKERTGGYEVIEWGTRLIPNTMELMGILTEPDGFLPIISRKLPSIFAPTVPALFASLLPSFSAQTSQRNLTASSFDWALHPGGTAVIRGCKEVMGLTDEQLRATREVYRTRGNMSSASVLFVLDWLRGMGEGKENVVVVGFGPGLITEMVLLRRVRAECFCVESQKARWGCICM